MSSHHTPAPWLWHWRDDEDAPGSVISMPHPGHAYAVAMCPRYGNDRWEADASRIVACVNACEGIPTEQLEGEKESVAKLIRAFMDICSAPSRSNIQALQTALAPFRKELAK